MSIFKKIFCCSCNNIEIKDIKNSDIEYFTLQGYKTKAKIVSIYDGDTCSLIFNYRGSIVKYKCRLNGLDCPELAPAKNIQNRNDEVKKAIISRNEVVKLCTTIQYIDENISKADLQKLLDKNSKLIDIQCLTFDKYGRLLVDITSDGININKYLISKKLAKVYDGGTKE